MTPLRDVQAAAARERFVTATLEVISDGREPTMRNVARQAGVSERTIYRYYPSRDDLFEAVTRAIKQRAHVPMCESFDDLGAFVEQLYGTFDVNEALVRGLVNGSWAASMLTLTRSANLAALRSVIDDAWPDAPEGARASAAATLRVLFSGAGWVYLRDCGFETDDCVSHVHWLIDAVHQTLRGGGDHA